MRWAFILCTAFALPAAATMTVSGGAITGTVVDEASGAPVPNAVVAAVWSGGWSGIATSGTVCVRGDAVRADAEGRFTIPAWTLERNDLEVIFVDVAGYAPGWSRTGHVGGGAKPKTWLKVIPRKQIEVPPQALKVPVKRFSGTPRDRGEDLSSLLSSTDCRTGQQGGLEPFYLAIRAELLAGPEELRHYRREPASRNLVRLSLLQIIDQAYLPGTPGGSPADLQAQLYVAIKSQDLDAIARIAASGAELNGPMGASRSPSVMIATTEWAPKSVGALARAGANVDATTDAHTPLEMALLRDLVGNGPSEQRRVIVQALLDAGANPNHWDSWCSSPLMYAAKGPDPQIVEMLLAKGARINDRCECDVQASSTCSKVAGRTALHYAWRPGVVSALLKAGADVNARDVQGSTALIMIFSYPSRSPLLLQSAELLVAAGARLDDKNTEGVSAASLAGAEVTATLRANEKRVARPK